MADLQTGILVPLLNRVRADDTLDLHIRENYLNVYYRGKSLLMAAERAPNKYVFGFDAKYFDGISKPPGFNPNCQVLALADCNHWLGYVPTLKDTMDRWLTTNRGREREAQQLLVRENTWDPMIATGTDYFVIDVEYAYPGAAARAKADAVAVHWPSTQAERKRRTGHRLALVEIKFGDAALTGKSSLHKHVNDAEALACSPNFGAFRDEMLGLFSQKHDLGLIEHKHKVDAFDEAQLPPLELIFVLADHDPASTVLGRELQSMPAAPHVEVRIATASDFGYGLYSDRLLTVQDYLVRLGQDS